MISGRHVEGQAYWIHLLIAYGLWFGGSFPLSANPSFFLKAAHSSTSSAQCSPKEISGDNNIVWVLENQSSVAKFADVVEICAI